ncbi:MAG: pyruvate kinase [Nitrospiraceae bacterium]|nr:MAG: pyruvate kinase [Nitrospiraceae bacterium]
MRDANVEGILRELTAIRADMIAEAVKSTTRLRTVHQNYQVSARNLLHYLALRRRDLRPLQLRLAEMGLSSLGRAESHVLATVDTVLEVLHRLAQRSWQPPSTEAAVLDFASGQRLLAEHTQTLLGPAPPQRGVRIMVTMPSEAADDYLLVHNLLRQGMNCMRINCAHDNASAWSRMIEHLKRAEQTLGLPCRIVMDLAGPKLRTGPLQPGPAVVRIRPCRDIYGRVTAPARIWLTSSTSPHSPPSPAEACLPVTATWLSRLRPGEQVKLADARNAKRTFAIVDVTDRGCWAEATQTTYVIPGTVLHHRPRTTDRDDHESVVGELPPGENVICLHQGDLLILQRDLKPGRPACRDSVGRVLSPASIGCTIPDVFDDVRSGESIWFDDGKIGGVIEDVKRTQVLVRITRARIGGEKLRSDKGINLPESDLRLAALTPQDLEDLSFVAQHADVVELSFANSAQDVELLQQHLVRLGSRQPAIVLKIETRRGFENLPEMLLTAMRAPCCGVMIARGDLAVECGFERLAEVQEEILWVSEAAHVPVIWATQVLETLAKSGMPSRAEITDAAMGHRAECVMLNKGPHMLDAVRVLDDILRRMQSHQAKRRALLRELRLAQALPDEITRGT